MIIGPNTKRKNDLIVDCDGVLLDTLNAYLYWFMRNIPEAFVKILGEFDVKNTFSSFIKSSNFSKIPATRNSVSSIDYLKEIYNLTVVTSVGDSRSVKEAREKNLQSLFGKNTFDDIHFLPFRSEKTDSFSSFNSSYPITLIDDETKNLQDGENLGFDVYRHKYYDIGSIFEKDKTRGNFKPYNWVEIVKLITENNFQK